MQKLLVWNIVGSELFAYSHNYYFLLFFFFSNQNENNNASKLAYSKWLVTQETQIGLKVLLVRATCG